MKYFFNRVKPLFIAFMAVQTLVRLGLSLWEKNNLSWTGAGVVKSFATGMVFDVAVFAYFLIPVALYFLCLPSRLHGGKADKIMTGGFYFILMYIVLFTAVSETIFWEEFSTRFNFIAVDYLVYTHEVIGNIWESYPIVWLLAGIGAVSFLLMRLTAKFGAHPVPRLRTRAATLAAATAVAAVSFFSVTDGFANVGDNIYWQEISKNGTFELFSAFRNNDLSYERFYAKTAPEQALAGTRKLLEGGHAKFTDAGLTHRITATGAEKHYNIMLVTVESLSGSYLTTFGNKDHLTPHLDKIVDESLFFTNLYATGTRTVYGLSAVTLSIPPVPGNSIVRRTQNENLFSLASVLNQKGYDSKFLYGGHGYFDNMNYFFENNGYQIIDRPRFAKDEVTFSNVWGVCDEDLFAKSIQEADASYAAGKPFFNMMMTTSNHRPYTYPDGAIDIPSGKGGRAGGVKYTDYAIDKLLTEARKKPWFNDTIFVIIADHTASSAGKTALDPQKYHIPLIIYAPHIIKPQKITALASQIDMAPTLLGLMNLRYDSRFYGVDLRKVSPQRAYISNYQKLGYLTPDDLVILSPVNKVERFKRTKDGLVKVTANADAAEKDIEKNAVALFQSASLWRTQSGATGKTQAAALNRPQSGRSRSN
jgi:phosphoglycerol transferase MdoB-like AlkP superfamily enzyme